MRRRSDELLDRLIDDLESKYKPMAVAAVAEAASHVKKDEDDNFINTLLSVRQEYGYTRGQMKAILLVSLLKYMSCFTLELITNELHARSLNCPTVPSRYKNPR